MPKRLPALRCSRRPPFGGRAVNERSCNRGVPPTGVPPTGVSDQVELYSSFAVDHTDVISETTRYIEQKAYDSDVAPCAMH